MPIKLIKRSKEQGRQPVAQSGRPKPAFSYYVGDKEHAQGSVKSRKRAEHHTVFWKRLRLVPTLVAMGIILLSVVYSTTLTTDSVTRFAGSQLYYRTPADYRVGISKLLGESIWSGNKLTINTHKIEYAILQAFPEIDAANVALPIVGRRPTVTLHMRTPALLLTAQSHAYIIDMSGKIVSDASQVQSSERDKLLSVQDQSGLELHVGNQALTSATVAFIINFHIQIKTKQLTLTQVTLPSIPNEVDFRIKDIGYFIKTDSSGDARVQAGDFLAVKNSGVVPVEYMDVRVEEKVFYK